VNSATQTLLTSLRTTVSNIRANKQTFLISVMTIAISVGILGLFLIIFFNLNALLTSWNQQVQLVVYLKNDISPSEKSDLKDIFKSNSKIQSMEEVSKEKAWEEFKLTQKNSVGLELDLGFNPLPDSYKIRFKASENRSRHISEFAGQLQKNRGVESVEYGEKWIDRFEKFMIFCQLFLLGVGVLLSLGLILIISNTIRLSIYSRQDEIELMLLIGATPSFVKIPFIFEGILQGLAGSFVSLGFMGAVYSYLKTEFRPSIDSLARGMELQFISQPFLLMLVGLSILIGFVASYISTYQYMQVLNKR
jgi:cell division transport system permease protein